MTHFSMALHNKDHYQVLSLVGRLDLRSIHANSLAVKDMPLRHTLIDCSGIEFIDSSGLGMVASLLQRLNNSQKVLVLMAVSDTILGVLKRTRLDALFHIVENEEQAASFFN
jgi:anti-sigma B factor antagonist